MLLSIALGLAFVPLGVEGWQIKPIKTIFNIYTGPGYLGGLMSVINIILLIILFREMKLPNTPVDKPMKKVLKCK